MRFYVTMDGVKLTLEPGTALRMWSEVGQRSSEGLCNQIKVRLLWSLKRHEIMGLKPDL